MIALLRLCAASAVLKLASGPVRWACDVAAEAELRRMGRPRLDRGTFAGQVLLGALAGLAICTVWIWIGARAGR